MEVEQSRPLVSFDEASMEGSKSFVMALQELKNLRPQLYSAAEYCEKSYLHSEQKQMVLDNLKDYAVRALVNAVDHLGTVASKLTDLLEQQIFDVSTMDLKLTYLDQQLQTCQTYTDKEGLRQQQLLPIIPRHHKHYILPSAVNKKVHFGPLVQTGSQQPVQARTRLFPSGTPAAKTLSWHLASETKSTLKGSRHALMGPEDAKVSRKTSVKLNSSDAGVGTTAKSTVTHPNFPRMGPASSVAIRTLGIMQQDDLEASKVAPFQSIDHPPRHAIIAAPPRGKSLLSAFFVKHKAMKMKTSAVV